MSKKKLDFKSLQAKWYDKLKKSGFEDIERPNGSLKSYATEVFRPSRFQYNQDAEWIRSKTEYYELARRFLCHYQFESRKDRIVWERHSEGVSIRNTVKELKKKGFKAYEAELVRILRRLREQMYAKHFDE